MKIIITGYFGFPNGMGATSRALAYAQGLTLCGADVQVICIKPSEPASSEALNVQVSGIYRGISFQYSCGVTRVASSRIGAAWLYFKGLLGLICAVGKAARIDERCAILAFSGDSPVLLIVSRLAVWLHGAKLVVERNELPLVYRKVTLKNRFIGWFNNRLGYSRLDALIVISTHLEDYFRKILGPGKSILRIPIMVEHNLWKTSQLPSEADAFTITYCGNLDHEGEVDDLLRAYKGVSQLRRPIHLLIIGGGLRLSELKSIAQAVNPEGLIEFTGQLPREEIVEKLTSSHLLVLPRRGGVFSSAGFPTKLGEYLATGKPVITTATGDIPLYLQDGKSAYLIQSGDVEGLRDKLGEVIAHYDHALQIGQAGRRIAMEQFDVEGNCRKVVSLLMQLWGGDNGFGTRSSIDSLTFTGDVFMPRPVSIRGVMPKGIVINLEAPITRTGNGWPGKVNLKTENNPIQEGFADKVAAVCLANNHIMDYGAEGLQETIAVLRGMGLPHFGAGTLSNNCLNPLIVDVAGCTVALIGYVCKSTNGVFCSETSGGVMPIFLDKIVEDIESARSAGAHRVIVSLHWGMEEISLPTPSDVEIAHAIIDGGADIIIGHHAHRMQPYEVYRGKYIFYGLGNAFFPDLDVPSMCDKEGHATSRYFNKQHYWNQRSVAVTIYPYDMRIMVTKLRCRNDAILWGHPEKPGRRTLLYDKAKYSTKFKRMRLKNLLQQMVFNWLNKPKLPRARHFESLVSLLHAQTVLHDGNKTPRESNEVRNPR